MDHEDRSKGARRLDDLLGFYLHLGVYLIVGTMLVTINLTSTADYFWAKWPLLGWGIGVAFHGVGVFYLVKHFWINKRSTDGHLKDVIHQQ